MDALWGLGIARLGVWVGQALFNILTKVTFGELRQKYIMRKREITEILDKIEK